MSRADIRKDPAFSGADCRVGRDPRQAEADAERIVGRVDRTGPMVTVQDLHRMAADARVKLRSAEGGARRALVQRVEVADKQEAACSAPVKRC